MRKFFFILLTGWISGLNAQVKIGTNDFIHPNAILQIESNNNSVGKGFLLPTVSDENKLPINLDETANGMVIYDKSNGSFYTYNANDWIKDDVSNVVNFKENKSRFLANQNEEQSVICALLVLCGRTKALQFSADIDGENSFNNLSISRETATIKYGLINYDYPNAKFIIQTPGIYEISMSIPTRTGGLVSLTEGPRYQLRAYILNEDGSYSEKKLTDFAPDYYGVLGIGGDLNTSAFSSTQIRLKQGDYLVPRIDSPSATVSVAITMTAATNEEIAANYPREILFTKISD